MKIFAPEFNALITILRAADRVTEIDLSFDHVDQK
jgi:hypothetical protein